MKRLISLLIALPLLVSTAFAGGLNNFGSFSLDWSGGNNSRLAFYSPFTTTLSVLTAPRSGSTGTFSRASTQIVENNEGVLRKVVSGSPAITGARDVTNLLTYSEDLSNAIWNKASACTVTGTNIVNLPNEGSNVSIAIGAYQVGTVLKFSLTLSGSGTVTIRVNGGAGGSNLKTVTLSSTPTRYCVSYTIAELETWRSLYLIRNTGNTATVVTVHNAQAENVTGLTNQNPGEYVKTTSAAVTKFYDYENPYTVDANGVVTDSGARTPISNILGYLSEPASTNKVTCYSSLTESMGSTLTSGTAVVGRVYQIVQRTDIDWGAVGTLLSGTANTAGARYLITGSLTFDSNDTGAEVYNAVGTKATAASPTAIRGMTLSGDAAATAEIVEDAAALTAAGLGSITNGRVVKLDNSAGSGYANLVVAGSAGNTNPQSMSVYGRVSTGTGRLQSNNGEGQTNFTNTTYSRIKSQNISFASSAYQLMCSAIAGSTVYFLLPQLEEQPAATSPIITAGATATRAATSLSYSTVGVFTSLPLSGTFYWTPNAVTGTSERYLWGSYLDANNSIGIAFDGTNLIFRKRVGGANFDATKAFSFTAGTTYKIGWRINADYSTDLAIDGTLGTGSADNTAPAATTTFELGTLNGGSGTISSQIKDFKIYRKALPDILL